jgi:hypothetical protein
LSIIRSCCLNRLGGCYISRARQAFAIDIPLQSLFEQPTIAGLASRIDTSLWFKDSSQNNVAATADEMEEIEI